MGWFIALGTAIGYAAYEGLISETLAGMLIGLVCAWYTGQGNPLALIFGCLTAIHLCLQFFQPIVAIPLSILACIVLIGIYRVGKRTSL